MTDLIKLAEQLDYEAGDNTHTPHCKNWFTEIAAALREAHEDISRLRAELEEAKKIFTCDETRSIHCSTKEYPVAALIISYQTYGSGDTPGADYMIKCANLDRAIKEGYGDSLLIMLSVIGEQILIAKRNFNAAAPAAGAPSDRKEIA